MTTILINSEGIHAQLPDGKLVRFEDQEGTRKILLGEWSWGKKLENGTQSSPEGWEIVIQWQYKSFTIWVNCSEEKARQIKASYYAEWSETRQVAILKRTGEKEVELTCIVCGKSFMGPEPKMCCSGRDCGCMGLPIEPVVCSKECYDNGPNKKPVTHMEPFKKLSMYDESLPPSVASDSTEIKKEEIEQTARTPFGEAIDLLRDLADLQNGPPLERHRKEWEETMEKVYEFLNRWETKTSEQDKQ